MTSDCLKGKDCLTADNTSWLMHWWLMSDAPKPKSLRFCMSCQFGDRNLIWVKVKDFIYIIEFHANDRHAKGAGGFSLYNFNSSSNSPSVLIKLIIYVAVIWSSSIIIDEGWWLYHDEIIYNLPASSYYHQCALFSFSFLKKQTENFRQSLYINSWPQKVFETNNLILCP